MMESKMGFGIPPVRNCRNLWYVRVWHTGRADRRRHLPNRDFRMGIENLRLELSLDLGSVRLFEEQLQGLL